MLLVSFVRLKVTWIDGFHFIREENERRVKQVLVELGEDLRLLAEREVEELQLPMRDADIQRLCKQSQTRALQGSVISSFFYYSVTNISSLYICLRSLWLPKPWL